jgi:hypothetical protein
LLGWDTTGGDLRIPHFIGLHALQVLPLLALALTLLPATARLAEQARVRLVLIGAAGYAGLFALTLWQALRGQPLTAPDLWTIAAGTGLIVLVAGGAAAVLTVRRVSGDRCRRSAARRPPRDRGAIRTAVVSARRSSSSRSSTRYTATASGNPAGRWPGVEPAPRPTGSSVAGASTTRFADR